MTILFPIGFCDHCDKTVLTHSVVIENDALSPLLCVHCDQPVIFNEDQEHFAKEYQLIKFHYHVYKENESPQQEKGCGTCSTSGTCGTYYGSHS